MTPGPRDPVAKAFRGIGPKNPLRKLDEANKHMLWALLMVYTDERESNTPFPLLERMEEVSKLASAAAALANRIESLVFDDQFPQPFQQRLMDFKNLPAWLNAFANRLGQLDGFTGKKGHKKRILSSKLLLEASEFVRLKTGAWNDEHLADLLQWIPKAPDDLSGDMIRKRREHIKTTYPLVYAGAIKRVNHRILDQEKRALVLEVESLKGKSSTVRP